MSRFSLGTGLLNRKTKWLLGIGAIVALLVWIAFFDSHSIARRVRWHQEIGRVRAENERLIRQTEELQAMLEEARSDEVVEQIAREQYGMRKAGERVYRVKPKE